jgi:hypothetical protein
VAIRTLPAVQHKEDKMEDVEKGGEDHCPDEIRYACMSRPYARSYESDAVRHTFKLKDNGLFIKDMYESSDTGRASFNKFRIH